MRQWVQQKALNAAMMIRGRYFKGEMLSSSDCWEGVRHCLVVNLDDSGTGDCSEIVLRRLASRFRDARLTFVTGSRHESRRFGDLIHRIIILDDLKLNLWGLPIREIREKISGLGVEVAVDLSAQYNLLSAYVCMLSRARLRIGFAGPQSDRAFNYQIAPQQDRRGMELYRVMARYIG